MAMPVAIGQRLVVVVGVLLTWLLCAPAFADNNDTPRPLELRAAPAMFGLLGQASSNQGQLIDRGTLSLKSKDPDFGGLSGLLVSPDGSRFVAITDSSHWLTGTLTYAGGRLVGAQGGKIAPLLGMDGAPLRGKRGDAEGLAGSMDGDVFVSFEREHRIWRYPFAGAGLTAVPSAISVPDEIKNAPPNKGLEAITLLQTGMLLAVAEAYYDGKGRIRSWLLDPANQVPSQEFLLSRLTPFEVTDVRQLQGGDILTLERQFERSRGIGFAVRRFALSNIVPAKPIDGRIVARTAPNAIIANMEGMAVRHDKEGRTFVYVISDDNFGAPVQRTLLIMYELPD